MYICADKKGLKIFFLTFVLALIVDFLFIFLVSHNRLSKFCQEADGDQASLLLYVVVSH
jgi:hypothetical protein